MCLFSKTKTFRYPCSWASKWQFFTGLIAPASFSSLEPKLILSLSVHNQIHFPNKTSVSSIPSETVFSRHTWALQPSPKSDLNTVLSKKFAFVLSFCDQNEWPNRRVCAKLFGRQRPKGLIWCLGFNLKLSDVEIKKIFFFLNTDD